MEVTTHSQKETEEIGKKFAKSLKSGSIVALFGDLGAGKSAFVRGVARGLGIKRKITSPTYLFIKSYQKGKIVLHHIDLYRGESISDLEALALPEIFTEKSIVMIEWAERIKDSLPKKHIEVTIQVENENTRKIAITGN